MFRLALKGVKHNPKRLILTMVAVVLGVALVSATHIFTNSIANGFSNLYGSIYGDTAVVVEADPTIDDSLKVDDLTDELLVQIKALDGVQDADGGLSGFGAFVDESGEIATQQGPPTLFFNWNDNPDISRSTVIEGRGVQANGEIVIDVDGAATNNYEIGDTVTVASETGFNDYTLVGTVRFGEDNATQGATLTWVTIDDLRANFGAPEGFEQISVIASDGANVDALVAEVAAITPDGNRAISGEDKGAEQLAELASALKFVDYFTLAFALISVFVGAYIIANTFRIIVTQRTREIGLLRAIGVTGRQVRAMILLEATVVGLISSVVGIGVGYLIAAAIKGLMSISGQGDALGTLTLPPDALVWGFGVGMLVTLGSALLPAIHASSISPMDALREASTSSRQPLRTRNIAGGIQLLVGIFLLVMGLWNGGSLIQGFNDRINDSPLWVGVGAVFVVLGMTALSAQIIVPLASGMRGMLTAVFGVDGKLAAKNIQRESRRSSTTAAALMIGVMLLAMVATLTASMKTVVQEQLVGQTKAELFAMDASFSGLPIPALAIDAMRGAEGIDIVNTIAIADVDYLGEQYILGMSERATADDVYGWDATPAFGEIGSGVYVGPAIQDLGVEVGDTISLVGTSGPVDIKVTGLYNVSGDADFFVDSETGLALVDEPEVVQVFMTIEDGYEVADVEENVNEALKEFPFVGVQTPADLVQQINQIVDVILIVISALLASSLVIAILGVANTLLLSVTERTREIGLLRAVGMRKSSIWRMVTIESIVMAIFGALLGIILGTALGAAIIKALAEFGFSTVTIPWGYLAAYAVMAAIAGVVAAIWPAWRASRLNILAAIAHDG